MYNVSHLLGGAQIGEAMTGNNALVTLDLGGNNIGPDGMKVLSEALRHNTTLKSLELSYNPIGPIGAKSIADVARFHMNVRE